MRIKVKIQDIDTGNTYFTRTVDSCHEVDEIKRLHEDEDTRVVWRELHPCEDPQEFLDLY